MFRHSTTPLLSALAGALLLLAVGWTATMSGCKNDELRSKYPAIYEPQKDGEYCFKGADCQSGICEGLGCGPNEPGTCTPKYRICDEDTRSYCVCDGTTKVLLATCPDTRYRYARGCEEMPDLQ